LNSAGRLVSDHNVVVVVVQVLGDDYPIVLLYVLSDVVVSKLVGLAASNDLGRRNIGNLLDVNRLDVRSIDLVVVVGVDQGNNIRRLLILECASLPVVSLLLAINDNLNTIGIDRVI